MWSSFGLRGAGFCGAACCLSAWASRPPLPEPSQWEVRVTVATLIFPLWVHLPAEKGSRWCNLKPRSTPPGTLVFPVPSIFSMKFLCLSLPVSGGGREGGRSVAAAEKYRFFPLFSAKCRRAERRSSGGREGGGSESPYSQTFWTFCSWRSKANWGAFYFKALLVLDSMSF